MTTVVVGVVVVGVVVVGVVVVGVVVVVGGLLIARCHRCVLVS